jgi:hypothetical protein
MTGMTQRLNNSDSLTTVMATTAQWLDRSDALIAKQQ